jgi:hypothetical protein
MLTATAAGVSATALGALPGSASALAATSLGDGSLADAGAALGLSPAALPPAVPGTIARAESKYDVIAVGFAGSAGQASFGDVGIYPLGNSNLSLPLALDAGTRLARLDAYFWRSSSGTGQASIIGIQVDAGTTVLSNSITSGTGSGMVVGSYTTPLTVGLGQSYTIAVGNLFSSVSCQFVGAIYQYFPAKPALNLLPTPVRVYDSRPGFPPAVGTKSPLVGGAPRAIDLKANSSGVPAGATGALVNLVATGTTGASGGFLAVYRNGISWPGTSNANWSGPGQNVATTTLTALDSNALASLFANVATDVVVDVIAFYA